MVSAPMHSLPDWAMPPLLSGVRVWRIAVRMRASSSLVPNGFSM